MHRFRFGSPCLVLGALALAGCGRSPAPVGLAVADMPAVEVAATPAADAAAQPAAEPPPPTFPFPDDPAGRALPGVVAPPARATIPAERVAGPKPRTPPARVERPEVPVKTVPVVPPVPPAVGKSVGGVARVPAGFGAWTAAAPPRATLPSPPGVTARGPDPANPPAPAPTAKPAPERPAADDPATAAGDAAVVRPAAVVLGVAGFVRVVIPDPFELAEHVKGVPPAAAEPVAVPPRRPR